MIKAEGTDLVYEGTLFEMLSEAIFILNSIYKKILLNIPKEGYAEFKMFGCKN